MTSNSALGFTQSSALSTQYSTAPNGEQFPLPTPQEEAAEIQRLQALVADHRAQGHEIVIVLGVGFVGAVMAGNREAIDKVSQFIRPMSKETRCPHLSETN
ncbi:MAG: hypothetical protein WC856_06770 [Methylococcaceae bacterium]|jgi:hypothetical protein